MKKVICLLISALLCVLTACSSGKAASSKQTEIASAKSAESASSEKSAPSSSASQPSPKTSSGNKGAEDDVGIPGSNYTDIKVSLEQRGFSVVHPNSVKGTNYKVYNNNWTDTDSGIVYGCDMSIADNAEIISASFSIENSGTVAPETFLDAANNYIGFCATMPYNGSSAQTVKSWASKNISNIKNKPKKEIGNAGFQLSGTNKAIILNVSKVSSENSEASNEEFYINKP